jgi:hypothetical protein
MALIPTLWDPGLPIRNTWYAYNSRSHDHCVVNPHIRVDNRITSSITVPNNILTIGHMTKYDIAMQDKSTTKQRIPSSVDDPRHAYYPTGNWLRDVPSSHRHHRNHLHLPHSLLHSLTKLIARDKAVSIFWNCTRKPSKESALICSLAVPRKGSSLVYVLQKHGFLMSI